MTNKKNCQVITFASIKGGVGKSSLAILTARYLKSAGKKVCLLDLDIQRSSTNYFLKQTDIDPSKEKNAALAMAQGNLKDNIINIDGIGIIAGTLNLVDVRSIREKAVMLLIQEGQLNDYDYLIIDTPGTYDNLVLNGINAADAIITPHNLTSFDLECALFLQKLINLDASDKLNQWYILRNRYRIYSETHVFNQVDQQFVSQLGSHLLPFTIPDTNQVKRAIDANIDLRSNKDMKPIVDAITGLCSAITGDEQMQIKGGF